MSNETKLAAGSFFLLFSVLSILACVGFLYKMHKGIVLNPRCIEVSAEVEKTILADRAVWDIKFSKTGSDQTELNKILLADRDVIQKFFEDNGVEKDDMEFSFFIHEDYQETKKANAKVYRAGYNLVIKSKDVEKILALRDNLSGLYEKGIVLSSNHIDFKCSTNEEVQTQLANEAAIKAYAKASAMAKGLHIKIHRIHKVYEPNYQIEGMNDRFYVGRSLAMMNSASSADGNNSDNSQPVPKRKIKVFLRMDVEIR